MDTACHRALEMRGCLKKCTFIGRIVGLVSLSFDGKFSIPKKERADRKKKNKYENFNNQEQVNIVMSCDKNQFEGLVAIVNSILIHTKQKNRRRPFHHLFFSFF